MRPIDADKLLGKILLEAPGFIDGGSEITKAFIAAMVKTESVTPTVDAVPVIRCKDCVHAQPYGKVFMCDMPEEVRAHGANWFCADGRSKVTKSDF